MRTRKTRRIGLTEADRLVAGNPPGPDHRGLAVLLDAATAPPSIEELAGETAAVTRFVAAFRTAAAQPSAYNRVQVRRPARMVAVKMAAGVAILAAGGTAVAAETGSFPAAVQRFFSPVDDPTSDGGPTSTRPGPGNGSAVPSPSPTPAPSRSDATSRPAEATKLILCRAWDAERTDPRGKPMPAASRHALAAEAGGEHRISDFCGGMLSVSSSPATSQPTGSASTGTGSNGASPGGNGDGKGDGNGDGGGNGQGNGNGGTGGNGGANGKGRTPVSPSSTPTAQNSPQA